MKLDDVGNGIGIVLCLAGLVLLAFGWAGTIEWVVEGISLKNRLTNAVPGLILAIAGIVILWRCNRGAER